MLAFEPVTGAIGLYLVEHSCRTRPARLLRSTRTLVRRYEDVLVDAAVNEVAEPLLDQLANAFDLKMVLLLAVILVLQRLISHRSS